MRHIVIFVVCVFLAACSSNNKDIKITQKIRGAGDCVYCVGWTWNDGEATSISRADEGCFKFEATVSGELTFYYKQFSNWSETHLSVSIDEKIYFHLGVYDEGYYSYNTNSYRSVNIGVLEAGQIVEFRGTGFKIADIQISK